MESEDTEMIWNKTRAERSMMVCGTWRKQKMAEVNVREAREW